jgi:hypothetical protein
MGKVSRAAREAEQGQTRRRAALMNRGGAFSARPAGYFACSTVCRKAILRRLPSSQA